MSTMPDVAALMPATRKFVHANGLDFEVFEAGEGPRLALLLHGWPEHAIAWAGQIPTLVAAGWRVWAVNQRGYGDTQMPPPGHYGLDALTGDVAGLIDASGATSVALIAHDWGALVAWVFAIRRIRPIEKLVIMNVPHPVCFRAALRHWRQRRKSWYTLFFQIPGLPERLLARQDGRPVAALLRDTSVNRTAFSRDELRIYAANAARPGGMRAMLQWYREAGRDIARARDLDRIIEVPTLVIWGEKDVALDVMCLVGTDRFVRDLRIERLPQASHWVANDAPDTVNRLLGDFVNA